jgi:pantoate kinase
MTPVSVTAFCPGHISGYFKRINGTTRATTGSIGAGIVISEGVTATVTAADTTSVCIIQENAAGEYRNSAHSSPPIEFILEKMGLTASVTTACRLPIGAGFGLSAAALLATLTAVTRLYDLDLTPHDIAMYAHESEVIHRTGLGDVAACQGGGRVERNSPGIDGEIKRTFDIAEPLYSVSFGPIHTPSVLSSPDQMDLIASAFPATPPKNIFEFFASSKQFAEDAGLITHDVRKVLTAGTHENVPVSMTMLGNGVFGYGGKAQTLFMQFGTVYEFFMAREGTRIIGENP